MNASDPKIEFPGASSDQWDAHAKQYAALPFLGPMSIPARKILAALDDASPLSQATAILDVGCGSGMMISHLASGYGTQLSSSARIIASDFSSGMVETCREKQTERAGTADDIGGVWTRLETAVYDAQDLTAIKDGELSHISGCMVYFMLPDPRKAFQEAYRALKHGGALSFSSFHRVEWIDVMNEAAKIVRTDAPVGFDVKKMGTLGSAEGMKGELEACGFKDVKTEYVEMNMPVQNPAMFANGFIRSNNPGALSVLGKFSPEEVDRVCEEFIKLVKDRDVLHGVVIIAVGTK